eukprot:7274181-Alexandrium_andersonii.AAC.1
MSRLAAYVVFWAINGTWPPRLGRRGPQGSATGAGRSGSASRRRGSRGRRATESPRARSRRRWPGSCCATSARRSACRARRG